MTTMYLIRHGETAWNSAGRFQGNRDIPLNDTGRHQSNLVGARLAAHPVVAVYTSDLLRASQTADAVASPLGLTPIRDPRLREADFGEWEGLTMPEIAARWPEDVAAWQANPMSVRPAGGELLTEVQARVNEAVHAIARDHPEDTVALVSHGGALRAVIALALGVDLSIFRRLRLDNCSVSVVRHRHDQFTLLHLNDLAHLGDDRPRGTWDETGDQWRLRVDAPR